MARAVESILRNCILRLAWPDPHATGAVWNGADAADGDGAKMTRWHIRQASEYPAEWCGP